MVVTLLRRNFSWQEQVKVVTIQEYQECLEEDQRVTSSCHLCVILSNMVHHINGNIFLTLSLLKTLSLVVSKMNIVISNCYITIIMLPFVSPKYQCRKHKHTNLNNTVINIGKCLNTIQYCQTVDTLRIR